MFNLKTYYNNDEIFKNRIKLFDIYNYNIISIIILKKNKKKQPNENNNFISSIIYLLIVNKQLKFFKSDKSKTNIFKDW